jgi:predicted  nucleic acid-binding Zn-ribbon protein
MYDGSIANAKELEALQHEIASLKDRRSRSEDALLEHMQRAEDLDGRTGGADEDVVAARARVEALGGDAIRELDAIAAELEAKRSARQALATGFDEDLLELYEDQRRQKHGVGAAAIVDGVCQACHEQLSAVELDRLKRADGVKRCEYCRRIVVFA